MDNLKKLLANKRKATEEEFAGKKFIKRSELEELRLQKLKEEEELERQEKVWLFVFLIAVFFSFLFFPLPPLIHRLSQEKKKRQKIAADNDGDQAANAEAGGGDANNNNRKSEPPPTAEQQLTKEEVMRRLRVLKQPVTLFAETDSARYQRLIEAERTVQVEDEAVGGQQENLHIALQREEQEKARLKQLENSKEEKEGKPEEDPEQEALMASFKAAAEALAEQKMEVEDRILKRIQGWMKDWEDDLAARDETVKASAAGRQADVRFRETEQYFKPLYARLKHRALDEQLLAGIMLIVDAMKERNYLHAYKIYMGVAIGNSPWPIGVTQVGLHERSAREKISFKYASGSAHIMNDEATRKFIQALKRLMTFCQRRYPTDPSRSVDFDGFGVNEGRGTAGAGSDKVALLEAMARGEAVAPAPAPSVIDEKGKVKIPEKWDQVLKDALKEVKRKDSS